MVDFGFYHRAMLLHVFFVPLDELCSSRYNGGRSEQLGIYSHHSCLYNVEKQKKKELGDLDHDCDQVKLQAAYFALRVLYFVSKRSTASTLSPLKMPWAMNEVNKSIINTVIGFLTS